MRDLKKDKAMCNAEITETPGAYTIDVEELEKGFYMWRERALMAEAENAQLRKVVDAAREFFEGTGCKPKECKKCDPKYINFCERSRIGQALAELDKEDTIER